VTIGDPSQKRQEQRRPPPGFSPLDTQSHRHIQQVSATSTQVAISSIIRAQKIPDTSAKISAQKVKKKPGKKYISPVG
jgi:hypothetical protein